MPATAGLKLLVRKRKFGEGYWIRLIETRRELLKPHLGSFTLEDLGSVRCLAGPGKEDHGFAEDGGMVTPAGAQDQGIYICPSRASNRTGEEKQVPGTCGWFYDGTRQLCGLTRSGEWLVATIFLQPSQSPRDPTEKAGIVLVKRTDIRSLLREASIPPQRMWNVLGEAVRRWEARRRQLYEIVRDLRSVIEMEDAALDAAKVG